MSLDENRGEVCKTKNGLQLHLEADIRRIVRRDWISEACMYEESLHSVVDDCRLLIDF